MDIPTVFVEGPNGPTMINASDYDPAVHSLCADQEAPPAPVAIPDYVEPLTVHPATVTVEGVNGPTLINASDYDAATHTLLSGEPVAPAAPAGEPVAPAAPAGEPVAPAAPAAPAGEPVAPVDHETRLTAMPPAPVAYQVKKIGRKFFIMVGEDKAVGDWIDQTGYAKDSDAWAAVLANQQA